MKYKSAVIAQIAKFTLCGGKSTSSSCNFVGLALCKSNLDRAVCSHFRYSPQQLGRETRRIPACGRDVSNGLHPEPIHNFASREHLDLRFHVLGSICFESALFSGNQQHMPALVWFAAEHLRNLKASFADASISRLFQGTRPSECTAIADYTTARVPDVNNVDGPTSPRLTQLNLCKGVVLMNEENFQILGFVVCHVGGLVAFARAYHCGASLNG